MLQPVPRPELRSRLRLARTRAQKLARLSVAPRHWNAVRAGVVPSVEHTSVPFLDRPGTVIDVGASRGQFALFALDRYPEAQVISFEPLPEAAARLAEVTGGRVKVINAALGPEPGTATMHVSAQDDSSSLLPIGRRQVAEYPGTQADHTLEVTVSTLESVLSEPLATPILLKIDVQGFELGVLRGAGPSLALIDQIFVECSFVELYEGQALADEVIAYLLSAGLRLRSIHSISYDANGAAIQADLLFGR